MKKDKEINISKCFIIDKSFLNKVTYSPKDVVIIIKNDELEVFYQEKIEIINRSKSNIKIEGIVKNILELKEIKDLLNTKLEIYKIKKHYLDHFLNQNLRNDLVNYIFYSQILREVFRKNKFINKVFYATNNRVARAAIYNYSNKRSISSIDLNNKNDERMYFKKFRLLLRRLCKYISKSIKYYFEYNVRKKMKRDVLIFSRNRISTIETKKGKLRSDYLFWKLFEKLNEENVNSLFLNMELNFDKLPNSDISLPSINIMDFMNIKILIKSSFQSLVYFRKYNKILKKLYSKYKQYPLNLFFDDFFSLKNICYLIIYESLLQEILYKTKPKIVISNDDCIMEEKPDLFIRYFLFVVQSSQMPEWKIQWKETFYKALGYDFIAIPDIYIVTGHIFKEKIEKHLPFKRVIVTGQSRYDNFVDFRNIYSKEKFFKKYKINPNHKIVLWTTQCHGLSYEENIKNFKVVFKTIQNLKNTTLIIKQHPAEGKKYTKMIKKELKNYKINAIITPKDSDTYEQLFVCDLMITRHSTTATEAVALNKPVIILNLSGEPDPVEYVKEGVALGVYNEKDLKPTIEKLLRDDSELAKNRKSFIEKYLYKMDGKATERVVNLILETIEEWRRKKYEAQNNRNNSSKGRKQRNTEKKYKINSRKTLNCIFY